MPESLHLVQLFFESHRLLRAVSHHRLAPGDTDLGYLLHAELAACFGDLAPKPFRLREHGRRIEVLGYGRTDAEAMRRRAEDFADPIYWNACSQLDSKPLPVRWTAGRHLGFEVRACPVVRLSSAIAIDADDPQRDSVKIGAGAEVDSFLRECWRQQDEQGEGGEKPPVDRTVVYRDWLADATGPAVRLENVALERFRLATLTRRTQGDNRKAKKVRRPDATLRGQLEIVDPDGFVELLGRGVGRHRAFGFGMLLLRPPG